MEFCISNSIMPLFYIIGILYFVFWVFLIIKEIKNDNPKLKSFLWIVFSLIIPILPFIYVIMELCKYLASKRKSI